MTLTNDDREHLRQFLTHPGYRVLQAIADSYIETLQEVATYTSQIDPLANREKIAMQWAAVTASKGFRAAIDAGVKFEIAMLSTLHTDLIEDASYEERRRIWDTLGMLEPMPKDFHNEAQR